MNIVIPMAGRGSRFQQAGFTMPKPLIETKDGKPMIQTVVENIGMKGRYIFLVLKEHYEKYSLKYLLPLITAPNPCEIVQIDQVTEGAACTVLLAKDLINNDDDLLIANSDQWADWDPDHFLRFMKTKNADGGVLTWNSTHPKWSYARLDLDDPSRIVEVAEKRPISQFMTVGIYWFARGGSYVWAAEQMISKDIRTNNEFYVCPAFNEMIEKGMRIYNYPVADMKGLGTPEDLAKFLAE